MLDSDIRAKFLGYPVIVESERDQIVGVLLDINVSRHGQSAVFTLKAR
jgi:hypothetical protein